MNLFGGKTAVWAPVPAPVPLSGYVTDFFALFWMQYL